MLVLDSAVVGGERAKILDFGIAKLLQGPGKGTASQVVMGTPMYMSPEQCAGSGGVDDKTDVYALGVMLYEMLAGRPPFLGETHIQLMGQHAFAQPPPLLDLAPKVPAEMAAWVHGLLVKDKALRPTMRELEAKLSRQLALLVGTGLATAAMVDSDQTRSYQAARPPSSTLGGSLGQTVRPAGGRAVRIAALSASTAALVLGLLFLGRDRLGHKAAAPTVAQPSFTPRPAPAPTPAIVEAPPAEKKTPNPQPVPLSPAQVVPPAGLAIPLPEKTRDFASANRASGPAAAAPDSAELGAKKKEPKLPGGKPKPLAANRPTPPPPASPTGRTKTLKDYDD